MVTVAIAFGNEMYICTEHGMGVFFLLSSQLSAASVGLCRSQVLSRSIREIMF